MSTVKVSKAIPTISVYSLTGCAGDEDEVAVLFEVGADDRLNRRIVVHDDDRLVGLAVHVSKMTSACEVRMKFPPARGRAASV